MLKFNSGTRIWTILETKVRDIFTFGIEPIELVHGKVKFLMGTKEIPFPIPIFKKTCKTFCTFSDWTYIRENNIWGLKVSQYFHFLLRYLKIPLVNQRVWWTKTCKTFCTFFLALICKIVESSTRAKRFARF